MGTAAVGGVPICAACGARSELFIGSGSVSTTTAEADGSADATSLVDAATVSCTPGDVVLNVAEPEVMFVLDRSGSMNDAFSGTASRWAVLRESLAAALPSVNQTMAVGALTFPTGSTMDDCTVASAANLAPALGNVPALIALLDATTPGGATPTADAIDVAASLLLNVRAASTARALVLATDGAPNCNSSLDGQTCVCGSGNSCNGKADQCLDQARTVAEIAAVEAQGVPTYVIGIASGDTVFSDALNAMAVAGGRPLIGGATSYYPAPDEANLETAVATIRDQVAACTYLTTSVPDGTGSIAITLGGVVIPYDPTGTNGWSWLSEGNGEIVFTGTACTQVTGAGVMLVAQVSCGDDAGD